MEFEDDAYVLSARAHGETGAIVELLTARHGKYVAHVAGGASRRMKPFLQAGARTILHYRARVSDQLGSAQLEPVGEGPSALMLPEIWPAVFVRFETGLLQELGFGMDLSKCAATGEVDDLIYVSPRTGRAVSRKAGEPYKDRLLPLPPFMLSAQTGLAAGDVKAGLDLTAHFLELFVFGPVNRPLPPARVWLVERLIESDRL